MRVRVVGVKRYTDRHGHERLYWRRKGFPSVALDASLTGAALAAEVDRLEKKHIAPKAKAGTLRMLIAEYKRDSNHWRTLRQRTRKDYERVYTWLGEGLDEALVDIDASEITSTRDKARDQHGAKFANQVVTSLKMPFRYGLGKGLCHENPAEGLEKAIGEAHEGEEQLTQVVSNRPLPPWEAAVVLDNAPPKLRPAIALALFFCLREGDAIACLKSARNGDWITTLQSKSRRYNKAAKPVSGYVTPTFAGVLDGIPSNDALTICVKENGTPWTLEGFKTAWGRYRDDLLKRRKIEPGVTFHGLRHTSPTILEDSGYDETQTRHALGHGPRSVSGHYGMTAERKKLLKEMALVVEAAIVAGRGNVVPIGNGSVYPPHKVSTRPRA